MSGVHAAARGARARRPPPSRAIRVLQAILRSTRGRSPETTLPAFRAFHLSLLHAKRSYLMAGMTTNPRAGWSCWCLYPTQFLFLYAGTFTWCVWPAILLRSTRLAATKGLSKPGRAQTGFKVPTAAARLEDPNKHTTHTSTLFPFGSGRGVRFALRVRARERALFRRPRLQSKPFRTARPFLKFLSNYCRRGPVYGSTPPGRRRRGTR